MGYTLNIEKPSTGLGVSLLQSPDIVNFPAIVRDPGSGPLAGRVEKYDRIISVNGVGGSLDEIGNTISENTSLVMIFKKPKSFSSNIRKVDGSIGLRFTEVSEATTDMANPLKSDDEFFIIQKIIPNGAVAQLNEQF